MASNDSCAEVEETGKEKEDPELTADVSDATPAEPEENILSNPDEITDVVLEVEGRELHTSRAVLAHYSPVFRAMFYSSFKEKSSVKVPLPGKQYATMVTFCNVLYPRSASAKCLINDSNLSELLTLADEYQTDKVTTACQNYIGEQLLDCFYNFYRYSASHAPRQPSLGPAVATKGFFSVGGPQPAGSLFGAQSVFSTARPNPSETQRRGQAATVGFVNPPASTPSAAEKRGQDVNKETLIEKLLLYLWACDTHKLPAHRDVITSLLVDLSVRLEDVVQCGHYSSLPHVSRADLAEELCRKLDGSRQFRSVSVVDKESLL